MMRSGSSSPVTLVGLAGSGFVAAVVVLAAATHVGAQDLSRVSRQLVDLEAEARSLAEQPLERGAVRSPTYVEERLTDGELYFRLQDYVRASIIFTDIVENYASHRAFPDAIFLLADSLFRAGDYLGALGRFRQILERSEDYAFRPYLQRALGRLIEIAIHTRNFEGVEEYFARLSRLPPTEIEAATAYYRAKYLYSRAVPSEDVLTADPSGTARQVDLATLDQARLAFEAVPEGSPYYPQSRYFVGVIYTVRGQYPQAIEGFERVLRTQVTTEEHQRVVELTHLALGRVHYETDQLGQAAEAYEAVPRTSPNFDVAVYEIAWVFIRQGDSTRAERALEILAVAAPESRFIPDGKLLRGNLLLRNGRFNDANTVFREVRSQFGLVRRELDEIVASHADPQEYFRELVRSNLTAFDANAFLPPLAVRWAAAEGDMDRAVTVLGDLSQARQLVEETSALVNRLSGAVSAPNRVNVFGDLRRDREMSTGMRNRLARAREAIMNAESVDVPRGSELARVREERRRIEQMLGRMPTGGDDFTVRNEQLLGRYRVLSRELHNLEIELLGMEARITATDRYLHDTAGQAGAAANIEPALAEIAQHRGAIEGHRAQIAEFSRLIDVARLRVGVGDNAYVRDERLRDEYNQIVQRERGMLQAAGLARAGGETDQLFGKVTEIESILDRHDTAVDQAVEERSAEMRRVIDDETAKLEGYRNAVVTLEGETEDVVGAVTYANFRDVRHRFYDLVLRADVGRVDVAWSEREEHRMRVDQITRDRTRELRILDDEFSEITDEQEGSEQAPEQEAQP